MPYIQNIVEEYITKEQDNLDLIIEKHGEKTSETLNLSKIFQNTFFYELIQEDNAVLSDFNDCWNDLSYFERHENYSSIINRDFEKIILHLLDSEGNRLIFPSNFFSLEFEYIYGESILRFANLGDGCLDISVNKLHLVKEDKVKIEYFNGKFIIYKNDKKIDEKSFLLKENLAYFSWRIPGKSYLQYKNFKIYNLLTFEDLFRNNNYLQEKLLKIKDKIQEVDNSLS